MIYLDHNSATYILPHIYNELSDSKFIGNSSSLHEAGALSKSIIDDSSKSIASLIGVSHHNILYTSGATESNAIALESYRKAGCRILASALEHKSVSAYAHGTIQVTGDGHIDLDHAEYMIAKHKEHSVILACMYANNETGVILDHDSNLLHLCIKHGARLHIDASQCYPKGGQISKEQSAYASTIVLSGHKMHAMKGVGLLAFSNDAFDLLEPIMLGGAHQWGLRPGTMNTEAIYSLGAAARYAQSDLKHTYDQMHEKISYIEDNLSDISTVNGDIKNRLYNTTNLFFPKVCDLQIFLDNLSKSKVMISGMSACDSGLLIGSPSLSAMFGSGSERLSGSIRISVSAMTTWQEIEEATDIIRKIVTEI
jgi:cysteine desulfurase